MQFHPFLNFPIHPLFLFLTLFNICEYKYLPSLLDFSIALGLHIILLFFKLSNLFDLIFWPIPQILQIFHFQGFQLLNSSIIQLFKFIQLWSCLRFVSLPWIKHLLPLFKGLALNQYHTIHWHAFIFKHD